MKYDERHTIKGQSNGQASSRVAIAITGKTSEQSKQVSSTPISTAPLRFWKWKIRRAVLFIAGLVGVTAGGLWLREWWTVSRFIEATDDAFVGADITTIASKVPGFIVNVAVTDNQRVRAGDLLMVVDDRDYTVPSSPKRRRPCRRRKRRWQTWTLQPNCRRRLSIRRVRRLFRLLQRADARKRTAFVLATS
jgi:multidrug efflux pump subunit AcrA (membrane-fusion protein)